MSQQVLFWIGFNLAVVALLVVDLGVLGRRSKGIKIKEALLVTAVWISLALAFNAGVYYYKGRDAALTFLAGYLIEYSLSVDNLFVFLLVFSYFKVPDKHQHKVLFLGILGALVMRGVMIVVGAALIDRFHWILYIFGLFLVYSGYKMVTQAEQEIEPESNPIIKLVARFIPILPEFRDDKFFVYERGKRYATLLFVVLVIVETTDLVFALDSIPAIFGITTDPFIVYTSNVFAILGLRSLYFALARLMDYFHYLKIGLAVVLVFVGAKMMLSDIYHLSIPVALGVIVGVLIISIVASVIWPKTEDVSHAPSEKSFEGFSSALTPGEPPSDVEVPSKKETERRG